MVIQFREYLRKMRAYPLVLVSLLAPFIGACSIGKDDRKQLIEAIETAVELPVGALPLDRYERYYTNRDGVIVAVYTIHPESHREQVLELCRAMDDAPFPCPLEGGDLRLVDAGQSIWVEDPLDMPIKFDGGCSQVDIEYSSERREFMRVECTGVL